MLVNPAKNQKNQLKSEAPTFKKAPIYSITFSMSGLRVVKRYAGPKHEGDGKLCHPHRLSGPIYSMLMTDFSDHSTWTKEFSVTLGPPASRLAFLTVRNVWSQLDEICPRRNFFLLGNCTKQRTHCSQTSDRESECSNGKKVIIKIQTSAIPTDLTS
jgi:hypothetical protein